MKLPLTRPDVQVTPRIKQRIVNWLLDPEDDVHVPAGIHFGQNSVTVGAPTADDIQFDADGGLAQQDGTVVMILPNDGTIDWQSNTLDNIAALSTDAGTVDGDEMVGFPSTTSTTSLTLGGSFTVVDANRPVILIVEARTETDGSTPGQVNARVDESGGSSFDYQITISFADDALPSGTLVIESTFIYLPPGASVKISNNTDPNNSNQINDQRKIVL